MEAPNLERTSSLTWSGIGGLNWDRSTLLPSVPDQPRGRTASASVTLPSSSRLSGGFGREEASRLPLSVDALLGDDLGLVPPPSLLKRAVTFSGDFPQEGSEPDPLVATPPGLIGMSNAAPVFTRQRATSDAAAVRAAWSSRDVDPMAPSTGGPMSYSPAHHMLPRRSHSLSLDRAMWGPDSPRERSRTTHTLSVGSPDKEVYEMADPDEFTFATREKEPSTSNLSRLAPAQFPSPIQHGMYASGTSAPLSNGNSGARYIQPSPSSSTPQMHQQYTNAATTSRVATPPFNTFGASAGSPPAMGMSAQGVPGTMFGATSETPNEANLLELQMQNLQVMQQQWMQMMQMQFDQTLYATQQRLQSMQVGGPLPQPPGAAFPGQQHQQQQQKLGRGYNGAVFEPGTGYTPNSGAPQQHHHAQGHHHGQAHHAAPAPPSATQGYQNMYPSNHGGNSGSHMRNSPPAHKQNRRPDHGNGHANSGIGNGAQGNNGSASSALLAEHKVTGRRLTAQELAGHVVEFSRDSHGSRLVQYKMETGTPEERRAFVAEALPHALSLARDLFGNYVVQNFFDNAAQDQRDMLASMFKGSVGSLCTHPHGCRVVQRALFVINATLRNDIIEELLEIPSGKVHTEAVVRAYARDAHATHVLQKAVTCLQRAVGLRSSYKEAAPTPEQEDPPGERERAERALELLEAFVLADCIPLSMHQQACRLVQRILGSCEPMRMSPRIKLLINEVFVNIDVLAVHQNGNFVLQHMIEAAEPNLAARVHTYVCSNAIRLARHKFGSHLVEKCLACATQPQASAIVEKFLSPLTQDMLADAKEDFDASVADDSALGLVPSILPVLMKDPYANFVVQKAFDVVRGELRAKLSQEIRARTISLNRFSYGRHILTHINKAGALD